MGAPYQSQSASGYNSSPPPDDGSTVAANKITWATIKSKLPDPIKTLADAINSALRASLNVTPSTTSTGYTTAVGDHLTTVEVASGATISLGDAATMIAQSMGYTVTVYNKSSSSSSTVNLITAANTLCGNANGSITLPPGASMTFTVNQAANGYEILGAAGFATVVLTAASGTNTVTAASPSSLVGLYAGLRVLLTPAATNTGATTLNITPSGGSALTAKNIFFNGAALVGGELQISVPTLLVYDGTQFNCISSASSGNGLKLLNSGLASGATLDIVMTSYTSYAHKLLVLDLIPASDGVSLNLRVSTDGGSTYDAGSGNYSEVGHLIDDNGTNLIQSVTSDTAIALSYVTIIGNGAAEGISALVFMPNTTSTAKWPRIQFQASWISADPTPRFDEFHGGGARRAAQDTDAIRLFFSTGNIASGTWRLYGYN